MEVDGGKEAEQGPAVKVDSPELGKNFYFLMDCSLICMFGVRCVGVSVQWFDFLKSLSC